MIERYEPTDVLIAVKTYPSPSVKNRETVCTAGFTRDGKWVRLYPVDYRYRPREKQYEKYQWVRVGLSDRGSSNDDRKESRKPDLDSLVLLDEHMSSDNDWRERRNFIDRVPHPTLNELKAAYAEDKTSLGIVRPAKIHDLKVERTDEQWSPQQQAVLSQIPMFGVQPKPLRKIPFKFSYVFECADSEKPHTAMIEDWELGVLFLKEAERLGSDDEAAKSVKKKYLDEMCSPKRDTRFFMGTIWPYNVWVCIGVFWPPKNPQMSLL